MSLIKQNDKGFSALEIIIILFVLILIGSAAFYVHKHTQKKTIQTTNSIGKPGVPSTSAYLGAWLNPGTGTGIGDSGSGNGITNELSKLASFNQSIGRPLSVLHVWNSFKTPVPTSTLNTISQNGSVPLIDWGCTDVSSISAGSEDAVINSFANGLKSYKKPVFLRWYWEVNEMGPTGKTPAGSGCNGYNNGPGYIAAWQHIYDLFQSDGVSNVSFVWCPGYSGGNFSTYYPGDKYVDWIGVDRYERTQNNQPLLSFNDMFSSYYSEWSSHNKPMMIAETAAMGSANQVQYLNSIGSEASQFPQIKAVVYFDSIGPAGDWSLQGDGLNAFKTLANSQYFSYKN